MKKNSRVRRIKLNSKLTMTIVGFFFCVIVIKLCYVVLSPNVDGIDLTQFADSRNTAKETLYADRGVIYDVNGKPLAKNANSYKIIAILSPSRTTDMSNPEHVVDKEHTAEAMCTVLATEETMEQCKSDLIGYFSQDLYQAELGNWGRISEDERQALLALDLPGIMFETLAKKRQYINSSWASYILGYARSNDEGEIVGEMGIESYFNEELSGKNGYVEYQKDAYGYKMATSSEIREDAVPGSDIYLSIDSDVQNILENSITNFSKDKELEWAIFVVMDAKTGAIVGSATNPNFNPNTLENLNSYLNPLVGYQYEPGSTMKIFSWLAALENGIYNGDDTFLSGSVTLSDGTKIKDFNNVGWGTINYDTGFAYSSNVAATNLGLKLGSAKLSDFYDLCGFGDKTGITLPGEEAGSIDFMYESELANASFGQGISVTPIQLLQAMSAFANDGVMVKPYIVSKIVDSNGNVTMESKQTEVERIASSESINKMKELMYNVVYNSFSYNKGYAPSNVTIAGKTGTAQIASPTGGYLTGEYDYIKSFLGMFPYEDPQYVFYFATKQFKGSSNDIYHVVSSTIEDVANIVEVTKGQSDVDSSKIIEISQYISRETANVVEDLKKLGLSPVVIGNGTYVTNQYPLKGSKVISGSKVFIQTNDTTITMPDVAGWSTNELIRFCDFIRLSYTLNGYGKVLSTNIPTGTVIDTNTMNLEITLGV
ncbi:TPA: PASTA domain-containing protein [Candidatus Ventrenecus stercoripullorum]|nr:PASTA domain-containing protein [Candidatus Ventrenecus stercoripullorum]